MAAKKGSRGKASKPGKAKKRGGAGGARPTWARRLAWWLGAFVVGALAGCGAVVGALYVQALRDVDHALEGPVWSTEGRVVSAPIEVWPGLRWTPAAMGQALVGAGYSLVAKAEKPGDVAVDATTVHIQDAVQGALVVTFADGRVASVGKKKRLVLRPMTLAAVRGPDNEARHPIALTSMPTFLKDAVLSMEDARFYDHAGVDPIGVLRAIGSNAMGRAPQGGSTITQQLAKNLFLTQERTLARKGREAVIAAALEARLDKDKILELYLNEIYLGQVGGAAVCGMDEAARAYFGTSAERLTLGEAATLAGIISAPNTYSPLRHPEKAKERRDLALGRMVDTGKLDAKAAEAAKKQDIVVHPSLGGRQAPWAVVDALDRVDEALGPGAVAAEGLVVRTTIQPALQALAEDVVATSLAELEKAHPDAVGVEVGMVALRVSDGAVVALVGGRDYEASSFDRATLGSRQVGSTVKPLSLAVAFDQDPELSPATLFDDAPIERTVAGKTWRPENSDHQFLGPVTLREAVSKSRNVPAVLLSEKVGMGSLARAWKSLGLTNASALPSAALGAFTASPAELAGAYDMLASGGVYHAPWLVAGVDRPTPGVDQPQAAKGVPDAAVAAPRWAPDPPESGRRVTEASAFLTTSVLVDVVRTGTAAGAVQRFKLGTAVAGKTGTTDEATDAWFVGYTPELVVAVWVGFDRDKALGLSGATAALPIWARFIEGSGTGGGGFRVPDTVDRVAICTESRLLATEDCPDPFEEYFSHGHAPIDRCAMHGSILEQAAEGTRNFLRRRRDDERTQR